MPNQHCMIKAAAAAVVNRHYKTELCATNNKSIQEEGLFKYNTSYPRLDLLQSTNITKQSAPQGSFRDFNAQTRAFEITDNKKITMHTEQNLKKRFQGINGIEWRPASGHWRPT